MAVNLRKRDSRIALKSLYSKRVEGTYKCNVSHSWLDSESSLNLFLTVTSIRMIRRASVLR